jgi:ATP-binding cassette subfamily B protein
MVSLLIATTGDLLLPVIIQRAVDDHLVARYTRIPTEFTDREELENVDVSDAVQIGDALYVQDDQLVALSGVVREDLVDEGILEEQGYYIFPYTDEIVAEFDGDFFEQTTETGTVDGRPFASIPAETLDSLDTATRRIIRGEDLEELQRTTVLFLILILSVLIFTFSQIYLMALTGQGVMKDMRSELFTHTVNQRLSYLSHHPVGRLVTRVTNDIETVNQLFTEVLINLLRNVALMFGSLVTIMLLNWRLGLVTMATLPPVLLITAFFRSRARDAFRKVRVWVSRVNAFLSEHLSGMSIVQLFVREDRARQDFTKQNDTLMKANLGEMYVFAVFRPLIDLLSSASIGIVVYYGAGFLLRGVVSLGVLIAFINLIRRFYRPVMQISEQFTILQSAMAGSERVFEMLDTVERIPDDGTEEERPVDGALSFDHVWFAYKPGEPVIKDLTIDITPGETIAIVGYTGAGKTTIANLLTRLWDIQEGSIKLDGVDIREYPRDRLRTLVQPIQQDVFLFSDTIRHNITLGLPLEDERVREVAAMVQADGFIERLPNGYDTHLSEGATNISTGQRQLLSFARILAHDPRIIIMDEATSNIDTETEQLIQHAVETVMENRTALVIAHRLSTIKNADRIMVLSQGRLVELGTHDELIQERGIYYNLYRLQYQE